MPTLETLFTIAFYLIISTCLHIKQPHLEDYHTNVDNATIQLNEIHPPKSPNDKRSYLHLTLPNSLALLLVSDPNTTKSSLVINLQVGSLSQPSHALGLAHYLEHMLFMGSKKYPGQNDYAKFIIDNGGERNGYTSDTETSFYFDISNSAYFQCINRMVNFLTQPLMRQDCMEREKIAIDNEYLIRISNDQLNRYQIVKILAQPPFSQFSVGNIETLSYKNVRNDLIDFYNKYYSSNLMTAVAYSNYTIQQMKSTIVPILSNIQNKNISKPIFGQHFRKQNLGKLLIMQTIKNQLFLSINWVVDYLLPLYKSHVILYICALLGDQGKNSLLSILKKLNYGDKLTCSTQNLASQSIIILSAKLTENGYKNYNKVYNLMIQFVKSQKFRKYLYTELKQVNEISYKDEQKGNIIQYIKILASTMHYLPANQLLNSMIIFNSAQKAKSDIDGIFKQMKQQNSIAILSQSENISNASTYKYTKTNYRIQQLPPTQKIGYRISAKIGNPFLPLNTKVLNLSKSCTKQQEQEQKRDVWVPQKILGNVYYLPDCNNYFNSKSAIQMRIYGQEDLQFYQFYANYLGQILNELIYPAGQLQSNISIAAGDSIAFLATGYRDTLLKVFKLLRKKVDSFRKGKGGDRIIFQNVKNNLIQAYQNLKTERSDIFAEQLLRIVLMKNYKNIEDMTQEVKNYQYNKIQQRIIKFWSNPKITWIFAGNFRKSQVLSIVKQFQSPVSQQPVPDHYNCLQLSDNITFSHQSPVQTSAASVYFQLGPYTEQLSYALTLLKNYIDEPFFTQLRTKKQIAYALGPLVVNHRGVIGFKFVVISANANPYRIVKEIRDFAQSFFFNIEQRLSRNNQKQLQTLKKAFRQNAITPFSTIAQISTFVSLQLYSRRFYFTRKQPVQVDKILSGITGKTIAQIWERMKHNSVEIHVVGQQQKLSYQREAETTNLDNLNRKNIVFFQRFQQSKKATYWPDFQYCCS